MKDSNFTFEEIEEMTDIIIFEVDEYFCTRRDCRTFSHREYKTNEWEVFWNDLMNGVITTHHIKWYQTLILLLKKTYKLYLELKAGETDEENHS